jgi:CheY-like chemotaxis protein
MENKTCKNVLIVEDDQAIRQMMQDVLEIQGYKVFLASNGREGTEKLLQLSPKPCVVLLDLMMPELNGWQFLDFQRSDPSLLHIPVVVCSAYRESARSVKPAAIIDKPVQLEALLGAVRSFCA